MTWDNIGGVCVGCFNRFKATIGDNAGAGFIIGDDPVGWEFICCNPWVKLGMETW